MNNVKRFYEGREKIIAWFKDGIFPFNYDEELEEEMRYEKEEAKINIRNKNGHIDYNQLMRKIGFKERSINSKLVKKHLFTYDLGNVLKKF